MPSSKSKIVRANKSKAAGKARSRKSISTSENKHLEQYWRRYLEFLQSHKYDKNGDDVLTHTAMGEGAMCGSFSIPDNKNEEFCDILSKLAFKTNDLYIVERPKEVGPLLIDIDWRFNEEDKERQYTIDDAEYLIHTINRVLKKYFIVRRATLKAFVFEKPKPSYDAKNNQYKDGVHIVWPFLALTVPMRHLVIQESRELVREENGMDHIPYVNAGGLDDVFDACVVESNGWMMYGHRKKNGQIYELTHVYKHNMSKEDLNEYPDEERVSLFSNRKFNVDDTTSWKDKYNQAQIDRILDSIKMNKG